MLVITSPSEMAAWSEARRLERKRIVFVPTMGFLHAGHVSLFEEGRRRGDLLVASIFVNPTQFGPNEDFARYPRDWEGDRAKVAGAGAELLYAPEAAAVYPPGFQTYVDVRDASQGLCGAFRPGHFVGVATVVCKLLNTVRPHQALFGEKDFQQLVVIKRMVADLNMPVEIVGMPTVREPDGLAMSSRNSYLSPPDRQRARALFAGLSAARTRYEAGERTPDALVAAARALIEPAFDRIDYIELRDAESLAPLAVADRPAVLAVAAFIGKTRLIDNLRLG